MTYKLFLDDIRDPDKMYPGEEFMVARTYPEACLIVSDYGIPDFISFDHDLGDTINDPEWTGYSFAKWIVEYMMHKNIIKKFDFAVHSANPIGAKNIEMYLKNYFSTLE